MTIRLGVKLGLVVAISAAWLASPRATSTPQFTTLEPGKFHDIVQTLPINIVFVGYEQGSGPQQIDHATVEGSLPGTYRAVNRMPHFYGIRQHVGTTFNYAYNFVYANSAFEDAFFGYLSSIAQPKPLTQAQELYNQQQARSLDVTQNHWIDAPSVEAWLAANGAALGIDTTQYTVFLINWYGRADFKFHVYVKTNEPDTDTGLNQGLVRDSRKVIAWGGTAADDPEDGLGMLRRVWFHDLSAGPEAWTYNFNLDAADLDGDGWRDYRLPPVWEYGNAAGYRPFDDLSGDLGVIVRYVAIDMLFTTSPLYDPAISAPRLPADIQLDVNLYQADPASNARDALNVAELTRGVAELQPSHRFTTEVTDLSLSGSAASVYDCWLTATSPPFSNQSCYGLRLFGWAFGDLFLYLNDHLLQFIEGDGDYEVPIFVYNTTFAKANTILAGFADDNYMDGTQSMVFIFTDPEYRKHAGFGITDLTIHEVGHHLGMSHPHDGYDYERDQNYAQYADFFFAWAGDESNTVMSYLHVNNEFSQFDRDNMNRWMTATYINQANAILPQILSRPQAAKVAALLEMADGDAADALSAYGAMDYPAASALAKASYRRVLDAAARIGVAIEPQASPADYKARGRSSMFVDSLDGYRLHLK